MSVTLTLANFDSGLYLLAGREAVPANAVRVATGVNPIHAHSVRSRNANVRLSTSSAVSATRFAGHNYTVDAAGNLRQDGTVIKPNLVTPGSRVTFAKAPPSLGATSYLFGIGGGAAFKIDESGTVTNWGIIAPTMSPLPTLSIQSAQAIFQSIDDLTDSTLLTTYKDGTIATDTVNFIVNPSATQLTVPASKAGGFSEIIALNLFPANATLFDTIQFYFQIDNPQNTSAITVQFDINGSGFTTSMYTVQVPVVPTNSVLGIQTTTESLEQIAQNHFYNNTPLPPNLDKLQINYIRKYDLILSRGGVFPTGSFSRVPAHLARNVLLKVQVNLGISVAPAGNNWFLARIPLGAFTQIGAPQAVNNWSNISGYRILAANNNATVDLNIWFNGLTFGSPINAQNGGGIGLLGDYSYYFTFANSVTGSYGEPGNQGISVDILGVDRNTVEIEGLPTSSTDPQIDTLIVWRTLGNGGIPYQCANIFIGNGSTFNGTFIDCIGDYPGFGPSPQTTGATLPDWVTQFLYAPGTIIQPKQNNAGNFCFVLQSGGLSDIPTPIWDQNIGGIVSDNTCIWQNVGTTLVLGLLPLMELSALPPTTASSCFFYGGTMFVCGDSAAGAGGRVYYSTAGFAEGLAGWTDISNDDDPTVGFATFANNLYVFTQKGLWILNNISSGLFVPGWTATQSGGIPGCLSLYSIRPYPLGILYQSTDNLLYSFDGYQAVQISPQIAPLFFGDSLEGYPAIGKIVASALNNREYWFSDGVGNTFAINVMPGAFPGDIQTIPMTVRAHGSASTALHYEPDTGLMLAGWNGGTYHLEVPGKYGADDGTSTLPFNLRTLSFHSGDKYTAKGQRLLLNANPGGNTIAVYISIDGVDYPVGTAVGTSRQTFEFPFPMPGTLFGAYFVSTSGLGQIEIFRVAFECDISGLDDVGTGGGAAQQLYNTLSGVMTPSIARQNR